MAATHQWLSSFRLWSTDECPVWPLRHLSPLSSASDGTLTRSPRGSGKSRLSPLLILCKCCTFHHCNLGIPTHRRGCWVLVSHQHGSHSLASHPPDPLLWKIDVFYCGISTILLRFNPSNILFWIDHIYLSQLLDSLTDYTISHIQEGYSLPHPSLPNRTHTRVP